MQHKIMDAHDLQQGLRHFTGSEHWYQHFQRRMLYTDGVKYLADNAQCYWLLDIIATDIFRYTKLQEFIAIKVTVKDNSAVINCTDGNENKFKRDKHIKFTDMPEGEWKLWLVNNNDGTSTLLIPSEY